MSTGQTILVIFAGILLTTILVNFYRLLANNNDDLSLSEERIVATTIGSSFIEFANGLDFDQATVNSASAIHNVSALTDPSSLGMDTVSTMSGFDDIDDFNGYEVERDGGGSNGRYKSRFKVYYVDPENIGIPAGGKTFLKRMDISIWRIDNYVPGNRVDTLRLFTTLGYFRFN
ncbi:MAG TPA: hypothetical protein VGB89_14095 [Bacteroidota bacterium]